MMKCRAARPNRIPSWRMAEDMKPLSKACPDCRGRGVLPGNRGKCPRCDGTGWVKGSGYQEPPPKDPPEDA